MTTRTKRRESKNSKPLFPVLYNVHDVAVVAKVSEETIRRWCRLGRVEYSTVGSGQYRFSYKQINQFIVLHPVPRDRQGAR